MGRPHPGIMSGTRRMSDMDARTYRERRRVLRSAVGEGAILLMGSGLAARNYVDNAYPFRQDSHFLYFVGVSEPDMAALLLPDGEEVLFGTPEHPDDLVWSGACLLYTSDAADEYQRV